MATKKYNSPPPGLDNAKHYDDWVKLVNIWKDVNDLPDNKKGPALLLTLQKEAQEAALQVATEELNGANGVKAIIDELDKIYKKNETLQKYEILDSFESYKRDTNTSMHQYIFEFEKRMNKAKSNGANWSDDLLAYRVLKNANLSETHEQLVKATVKELKYKEVKEKLNSVFCESTNSLPTQNEKIKIEDINYASGIQDPNHYYEDYNTTDWNQEEDELYQTTESQAENSLEHTWYNQPFQNSYGRFRGRPQRYHSRPNRFQSRGGRSYRPFFRPNPPRFPMKQGRNPADQNGQTTRCALCQSINHWAQDCPDKTPKPTSQPMMNMYAETENLTLFEDVSLYEADFDDSNKLKTLIAETSHAAVVDCGASKTCCGTYWWKEFSSNLEQSDKDKITFDTSRRIFKFGNGKQFPSITSVTFPAKINNQSVMISSDIIKAEVPLLLSRDSLKKANANIDFSTDTATVFNQTVNLLTTKSGHYAIPITKECNLIQKAINNNDYHDTSLTMTVNEVLVNNCRQGAHEKAVKLHRQFAHPPTDRLLKLVNAAGHPWNTDLELQNEIKKIQPNCPTCLLYKRPPPRPVSCLPIATSFQECVAMDLKFYNRHILLHLIDYATRLSGSTIVPSKKPDDIIKAIFKIWIGIFGSPGHFLTDNGGEFCNNEFTNMCEALNITVRTTGAESPWSNGIVERHNRTIAEMLDKILEENNCNIEIALAWSLNAKNSLQNVHGFSPYQLAFGTNPRLPSALSDKPPALTHESVTETIKSNLDALHKARKAFIETENSDRIRRALNNNIRTTGDAIYTTGDSVYYKRLDSKRWKGPAKVLGKDGHQILIKHGSNYARVHSCRLMHTRNDQNSKETKVDESKVTVDDTNNIPSTTKPTICELDGDDSDDDSDDNDDDESQNNATYSHPNTQTFDLEDQIANVNIEMIPSNDTQQNSNNQVNTEDQVATTSSGMEANAKIQKGTRIRFTGNHPDDGLFEATILNRAGKSKGKYKNVWNILRDNKKEHIDLDRDVSSFEIVNEPSDEIQTDEVLLTNIENEQNIAKLKELESWKNQNVFQEVENTGQKALSVRWVLKPKVINGVLTTKARLCARGFEEDKFFRTDSPTCSREGVRIALATIATHGWHLKSLDIRTAFLQGKDMERTVYLKPPPEANSDKLWLLNKCVYGLGDASRSWYLRIREEIIKSGGEVCQLDQGLFLFHDSNQILYGIIICFVDDMLYGGTTDFEQKIIGYIRNIFEISSEHNKAFTYIGIGIEQYPDKSIVINQDSYIDHISPIKIPCGRKMDDILSSDETTSYRKLVGQLNWACGITRPEIGFEVCHASTKSKEPTTLDVHRLNKVVKQIKDNKNVITFPALDKTKARIEVYTDASFNNLPKNGSQGGHVVFLGDGNRSCPIAWNSSRIQRVVRSTLAAETLALADGYSSARRLQKILGRIFPSVEKNTITAITDNKSLCESTNTTHNLTDKELTIDMSYIRERIDRNELTLQWKDGNSQLSNVLTKKGASPIQLMQALRLGKMV